MKRLHRPDLYGWSRFDQARNIDFHSVVWVREAGNVAIDPLPLEEHDARHLASLGRLTRIVVTNSDHLRAADDLSRRTGAAIAGPRAERDAFPPLCTEWLGQGDEPVPGLRVVELDGSKTPGELALLLQETTLVTGDLVRAHEAGRLCLLPTERLSDPTRARESVRGLLQYEDIAAVLPGDGWPVFRDGHTVLRELVDSWD